MERIPKLLGALLAKVLFVVRVVQERRQANGQRALRGKRRRGGGNRLLLLLAQAREELLETGELCVGRAAGDFSEQPRTAASVS